MTENERKCPLRKEKWCFFWEGKARAIEREKER